MFLSLASFRQMLLGSAGMGSLLVVGLPHAFADCPHCQPTGDVVASVISNETQLAYHDGLIPNGHFGGYASPHPAGPYGGGPYDRGPHPGQYAGPSFTVIPPPGTLGQTYLRKSWPIPKEEHPRTAIIQITASGYTEIEIEGLSDMEGFQRKDGVWIFKTKQPLIPGNPHIYHVKAGYKDTNQRLEVRTVRLIPGRVVTLEY